VRKGFYRIGIDLGGTKIHTAIARAPDDIVAEVRIPTEAHAAKGHIFENICRSVVDVCGKAGLAPRSVTAIGIAVPGPVDYTNGVVRICPNIPSWKKVPIRDLLQDRCECPVFVENDARAAALAEAHLGAGKGYRRVFYATVSTGIGGGIVIDGTVWHGAHGVAGEIGQTRLPDGSVFEHTAAGPAVKRLFGIAPEEIPPRLKVGDPTARQALNHLTRLVGIWLANVATLLDPDLIVIGGGLSNLGALFLIPLRQMIKRCAFSESARVKVVRAKLGTRSGVIGALLLGR